MPGKTLLQKIVAGVESFVPWKSSSIFSGAAQVVIVQPECEPYEIDLGNDTTPTPFGADSPADGTQLRICNIILSAVNGVGAAANTVLEYYNGSGWNRIAKLILPANSSDHLTVAVCGKWLTAARDEGEKFFRLTNSNASLDVSATILAHVNQE